MDIPCTQCGEPWDNHSFHDLAAELETTYTVIMRRFRSEGCAVFATWGVAPCEPDRHSLIRSELADILGDDIDGYAAEMEDYAYLLGGE